MILLAVVPHAADVERIFCMLGCGYTKARNKFQSGGCGESQDALQQGGREVTTSAPPAPFPTPHLEQTPFITPLFPFHDPPPPLPS